MCQSSWQNVQKHVELMSRQYPHISILSGIFISILPLCHGFLLLFQSKVATFFPFRWSRLLVSGMSTHCNFFCSTFGIVVLRNMRFWVWILVYESYVWLLQIWSASTWWLWSWSGASRDALLWLEQHPKNIFVPSRPAKACSLILDSRRRLRFGTRRFFQIMLCLLLLNSTSSFVKNYNKFQKQWLTGKQSELLMSFTFGRCKVNSNRFGDP